MTRERSNERWLAREHRQKTDTTDQAVPKAPAKHPANIAATTAAANRISFGKFLSLKGTKAKGR